MMKWSMQPESELCDRTMQLSQSGLISSDWTELYPHSFVIVLCFIAILSCHQGPHCHKLLVHCQ